jgi:hypothetical protein
MRRFLTALLMTTALSGPALAADLTLKHVILSSGGVGYFEYGAEVEDDDTIGLDVPLSAVDDVLKSLVVFDGAGSVAEVELPGRDDTVRAFNGVPFGPEALESPVAYLNALRGTDVTVSGAHPMTGRIVRAETVTETVDTIGMPRTRVTLLGAEGLRQFLLEEAEGVQITDPTLRAKVDSALESVRRDAGAATRHLSIRLKGKGTRQAAVGYVAAAPLWKATYRLVLPATNTPTARLQGWATLENQSGVAWKGVTMTLQYGNPSSFRQALYRSYFVRRPEVPVEILGQVLPDIDTRARAVTMSGTAAAPPPPPPPAPAAQMAPAAPMMEKRRNGPVMAAPANETITEETGEETIFTLSQPLNLDVGHSANVPILDRAIPASRIGLVPFQQAHPLASIRIKNDDTRALPAGALTLYDSQGGTSFAGDARLGGLPAGETRLLSFARDLRTGVDTKLAPAPDQVTSFSVAGGVLTYVRRTRQGLRIDVAAPARETRELLLEIPRTAPDQTLTLEDPKLHVTEQTATAFRVALTLAAGENRVVAGWLDQPVKETVALVEADDDVLTMVTGADHLSQAGRAALRKIIDLRQDLARRTTEVDRQRKLLEDVNADEERLRKNLTTVSGSEALHGRLTRALDADETRIEQIQKDIQDAEAEATKANRALTEAVNALKI